MSSKTGNYANDMITECKKAGMKPVCDHPSYCKNNANSLYLGQAHHMAYRPHRTINSWFPSGWSSISSNWNGLCTYTGAHGGNDKTLCNVPTNTHEWRTSAQYNPGFVCGKSLAPAYTWDIVSSKGSYGTKYDKDLFNSKMEAGNGMVKRECSNCGSEHKLIVYKRTGKRPLGHDWYDLFTRNWFDTHDCLSNVLNRDFELYSNEHDASAGTNKWKFCNYDDAGVGFPRDCGKTRGVGGQWNSFPGRGGNSRGGQGNVRFSIARGTAALCTLRVWRSWSGASTRMAC